MKAMVVTPGKGNSLRVEERPEPRPADGQALLRTRTIGICGSDREIVAGAAGAAPDGADSMVLGHECLAEVVSAPSGSGLRPGDLVVPLVRRPCGVSWCVPCHAGRQDMCWSGEWKERGIHGLDGFGAELFAEDPRYLVPVPNGLQTIGTLLEPSSIVAKAIDQAWRLQDSREPWEPTRALVLGAGPIGLLGAAFLRLLGVDVLVYDRGDGAGPKARWAQGVGARYMVAGGDLAKDLVGERAPFEVILECTGARTLVLSAALALASGGIMCLLGTSPEDAHADLPVDRINEHIVLSNGLLLGSVNAAREHFLKARRFLADASALWPGCLDHLITERLPVDRVAEAFSGAAPEIKTVIAFSG